MAPLMVSTVSGNRKVFEGKITIHVVLSGVIAATGGLMFGYDVGISGGVTAMDDFLKNFFPKVHRHRQHASENNYCKYDDPSLQLFTSSLYMAALLASIMASRICSKYGRRLTMQTASLYFILGVLLNVVATNLGTLIAGRLIIGLGVGFANQAVPLFLSEIAPVRARGALNILFQLNITVGILVSNVVNYYTADVHPHGWRISLGLAIVPACLLGLGSLAVVETPTSLVERERSMEGLECLRRIRGIMNVNDEFEEILHACEVAREVRHPFRTLLRRSSRPPLVIAVALQVFQQFTGINAVMFYAPVVFQMLGFGHKASLLSAVITGSVNVFCTMVAVVLVDVVGRRVLLLEACVQMLTSHVAIGVILTTELTPTSVLDTKSATKIVVFVCMFISGFAWSWGPLGWLIPSETFPVETRTAGFACAVGSNMLTTFLIAQVFLTMMCKMRAGIFFFFAAWIVVMSLFVLFFLPETKSVPIDEMNEFVWRRHWFWKSFMYEEDQRSTRIGHSPFRPSI